MYPINFIPFLLQAVSRKNNTQCWIVVDQEPVDSKARVLQCIPKLRGEITFDQQAWTPIIQ